jgi:hypothetical protein
MLSTTAFRPRPCLQPSSLLERNPDRAFVRLRAKDPEWLPDALPSSPPASASLPLPAQTRAAMSPMLVPGGSGGGTMSVIQFNCLAGFLASPRDMPCAAPCVLAWTNWRRPLFAGLARCAADIVCLQVHPAPRARAPPRPVPPRPAPPCPPAGVRPLTSALPEPAPVPAQVPCTRRTGWPTRWTIALRSSRTRRRGASRPCTRTRPSRRSGT